MEKELKHRAGFVNIIGNPNAGKSTLSNQLVGEKLSIISPKASTTRHRILGIINEDEYQVILSDTPGIIEPAYPLHQSMMMAVKDSIEDADVLIILLDVNQPNIKEEYWEMIEKSEAKKWLIINKIDTSSPQKANELIKEFNLKIKFDESFALSALNGLNSKVFLDKLATYLPFHEPFFPKDQLTDRNTRFYVSEIIREQMYLLFDQEIPYSTEVIVHDYKEGEELDKIYAYIIAERDSQKKIIVGTNGNSIKKIGINSRKKIEDFIQKRVFLDLRVKVEENWRKDKLKLKRMGYGLE